MVIIECIFVDNVKIFTENDLGTENCYHIEECIEKLEHENRLRND